MTTSRQPQGAASSERYERLKDPGDPLQLAAALGADILTNLGRVLLGAEEALRIAAISALAGGHLLIEDVPGVGKTVLAHALAASLGANLSRIQGHPDLLPSDITGVSVYSQETGSWEFRPGPVFSHLVLIDELNRTPPRTQSALLETMEEQQVTVDGETWPLPSPHFVIATQNPLSQRGTYPLVESQLDRFALATTIGYPEASDETQLVLQAGGKPALRDLRSITSPERWVQAQRAVELVDVAPSVAEYAVALCRSTRSAPRVRMGASPRAAIWLIRCSQAHALLSGRTYVLPDDIKAIAIPSLAHRLITSEGEPSITSGRQIIRDILDSTPSPRP